MCLEENHDNPQSKYPFYGYKTEAETSWIGNRVLTNQQQHSVTVLLKKLTVAQLVKKFSAFMDP
jgi:hypothetical protein